uniref:Uncharacterized protein n=1 Tax=Bionectria ochroleuca TaxID=29856 RepID=A0A8H7TTI3_BIOOC
MGGLLLLDIPHGGISNRIPVGILRDGPHDSLIPQNCRNNPQPIGSIKQSNRVSSFGTFRHIIVPILLDLDSAIAPFRGLGRGRSFAVSAQKAPPTDDEQGS